MFCLIPLLNQVQAEASSYTCERVANFASNKPSPQLRNEVILVAGFNQEAPSHSLIDSLSEVLNATVLVKGGKYFITRTEQDKKAMMVAEIAEIRKTYNARVAAYNALAKQFGTTAGSPKLAYSLTKEYASSLRIHEKDPKVPMPKFSEMAGQPPTFVALAAEKIALDSHVVNISPYQTERLCTPAVGSMKPLPAVFDEVLKL